MPILAVLQTGDNGEPTPVAVDDRELDFRSLDGSQILQWTGDEYVIMPGIQGLRLAPHEVITDKVPGLDGARLREIRTDVRTVVLPFFVQGDDIPSHLAQMDALYGYVDFRTVDYVSNEGTFDLVASRAGESRYLRCIYLNGLEGVDGGSNGNGLNFSTFDIAILAVDPHWRGEEWSTPVVQLPTTRPFLSNVSTDHPWGLSSSVALGADMPVIVGGNIPSPAVIQISGTTTSTHITSPQGLDITIGATGSTDIVVVDSGRRKRVLLNGVPAWNLLGDSPQWPPMTPGKNTISVMVTGADSTTRARVYGTSLWKTAW
jgi:hypothetical protein